MSRQLQTPSRIQNALDAADAHIPDLADMYRKVRPPPGTPCSPRMNRTPSSDSEVWLSRLVAIA